MKIVLGNFTRWRIRKILAFLICMISSVVVMLILDNDQLSTACILIGLCIYAFLIDLPFIKNIHYNAYVIDKENEISIKTNKKVYTIKKNEIKNVWLKEIKYGGRWLDVVGYRLIVVAEKKYFFDSVLQEDKNSIEIQGIKKLQQLFENAKKVKV